MCFFGRTDQGLFMLDMPVPASSKMASTEPIRYADGTSVITYLRKGKNCCADIQSTAHATTGGCALKDAADQGEPWRSWSLWRGDHTGAGFLTGTAAHGKDPTLEPGKSMRRKSGRDKVL